MSPVWERLMAGARFGTVRRHLNLDRKARFIAMKSEGSNSNVTWRGLPGALVAMWRSGPMPSRVVLAVAAFSALCVSIVIAALPLDVYLRTLAIDDALYYPVIAHSIANGYGSSIDGGITFTNGYHPLWCWLQVLVALPMRGLQFSSFLWAVKLLNCLVTVAAIVVWSRTLYQVVRSTLAVAVFVMLSGAFWGWSIGNLYSGMETALVLLGCGLVLLHTTVRPAGSDRRYFIVLGVLSGLTLLSRLDSVFFIGSVLASELLKARRAHALPSFLALAPTICTAILAPYLLYNQLAYGSMMPVSGIKKTPALDLATRWQTFSTFISEELAQEPYAAVLATVFLMSCIAALAIGPIRRRVIDTTKELAPLSALFVGATLHFVYTNVFMTEGWVGWYQYLERFTLYVVLGVAFGIVASVGRRPALAASVAAMILFSMVGKRTHTLAVSVDRPNTIHAAIIEVATWAREGLPADARVGMYDSGLFRVISERQTIALNGLAGDRELLLMASSLPLEVRAKKLVERYSIEYIVTFGSEEDLASITDPSCIVYVSKNTAPTFAGKSHWVILEGRCYQNGTCNIPAR
jgi:hypothetical protein